MGTSKNIRQSFYPEKMETSKPPLAGETLPPTYDQATGQPSSSGFTYSNQQIPSTTQPTQQPQVVHQTVVVQGFQDPNGVLVHCPRCNQNKKCRIVGIVFIGSVAIGIINL